MYTDCAMSPVTYRLESLTVGEESYREADKIADAINAYLDEGEGEDES